MNILYGVFGVGMGHATRSRVVLEALRAAGHDIRVVASQGSQRLLRRHFGSVLPVGGWTFLFDESNKLRRFTSICHVLMQIFTNLPRNVAAYFELVQDDFVPDVVITDFESWSHLYGLVHGIPVISLDNVQMISRCRVPDEIIAGEHFAYHLVRLIVKTKLPFCSRYLVSSFADLEVHARRTTLHPPVLRPEVLHATPTAGDHLTVYQSSGKDPIFASALRKTGLECRIYGSRPHLTAPEVEGNLVYMPFSERGFVADMASCRAVVGSAGASLISEALHLGKPMLAVPITGQFEQTMNGRYLASRGYGAFAPTAETVDSSVLGRFLAEAPRFEDALLRLPRVGNRALLTALDETLDTLVAHGR